MNLADSESRPVLGPAGNKSRPVELRKPVAKPKSNTKMEVVRGEVKGKKSPTLSGAIPNGKLMNCVVKKEQERRVFRSNLSMNASCSSDNSSDSSHSRASTGRITRKSVPILRKQSVTKAQKSGGSDGSVNGELGTGELVDAKKRCAWVTPNTGMLQIVVSYQLLTCLGILIMQLVVCVGIVAGIIVKFIAYLV